jgi:hypothetical protein
VALLKIPSGVGGIDEKTILCLNDYKFEDLFHVVGADLFVIGFPLAEDGAKFAIWKRGSIASELFAAWHSKPAFLIDCRTSNGMSGAPVVRRVFGPAIKSDLSTSLGAAVTSEFMGIYSGRLHDDDNIASIGIVWWRSVIDEILKNPMLGDRGP